LNHQSTNLWCPWAKPQECYLEGVSQHSPGVASSSELLWVKLKSVTNPGYLDESGNLGYVVRPLRGKAPGKSATLGTTRTGDFIMQHLKLGKTGISIPGIVFGTSTLGNLYRAVSDEVKLEVTRQWFEHVDAPVAIDSAGKYGAGLALEVIGRNLRELGVAPEQVVLSNKVGWKRVPLVGSEPTFEPGAWVGLEHDAKQHIGYEGIRECWEQGCDLLGHEYTPALASVHDPDEYLAAATSPDDRQRRFDDIVEAYRALAELKQQGATRAIGVGAKDWRVIQEIDQVIELDWVMLANSLTVYRHPPELIQFVDLLRQKGVGIINSAVFHGGFLVGGDHFDYRAVTLDNEPDRRLLAWREQFRDLCERHNVTPSAACLHYGLSFDGVVAVAVSTSNPKRIATQVADVAADVPEAFWAEARELGLMG